MSSDTYNGTDYCYDARWNHTSVPTNADVDGIVVAATSKSRSHGTANTYPEP